MVKDDWSLTRSGVAESCICPHRIRGHPSLLSSEYQNRRAPRIFPFGWGGGDDDREATYNLCSIFKLCYKNNEICVPLGYYAASNGNPLPTFRDNVSVPTLRDIRRAQISSASRRKPEITDYKNHVISTT
jgi:hypothetical protein